MIESWLLGYVPTGGRLALDVGANRGEWARMLATRFTTVHAIEPNPAFHADLRTLRGVVLHPVGAWSNDGPRWFTLFDRPEHTSAVGRWDGSRASPPRGMVEWYCAALDNLPIPPRVEFVKMDVEGAEYAALMGAQGLIERDGPSLLVEIHGEQTGKEVCRFLDVMRYRYTIIRFPGADEELWGRWFWVYATRDAR